MSRILLFALTVSAVLCSAHAYDTQPSVVIVVTPDGKPATYAKVWVCEYTGGEKDLSEPPPLAADAAGKVSVHGETGPRRSRQLFARDPVGRIGQAWVSHTLGG